MWDSKGMVCLAGSVVALLLAAGCSDGSDSTQPATLPETTITTAVPNTFVTLETSAPEVSAAQPQMITTAPPATVASIPPPLLDNIAVAAGAEHACSLHSDGTVSCWGENTYGSLGDGTNKSPSAAVQVIGISDASAIDADWFHTCALHRSGEISCWGGNGFGELGNGTTEHSNKPVKVEGINDATQIAVGDVFSCALISDGTVSCWGRGGRAGALGNGSTGDDDYSAVPVKATGITDAVAITAGAYHACALIRNGSIFCWGGNYDGAIGDGTNIDAFVPSQVINITDAISVSAAGDYTCAILQDRSVSCWGTDVAGNIEEGKITTSAVPVRLKGIGNVERIAAATSHFCLFRPDSYITCLGSDRYGMFGPMRETPKLFQIPNSTEITILGLHFWHTCAIYTDTTIYCWGMLHEDKDYIYKSDTKNYIIGHS